MADIRRCWSVTTVTAIATATTTMTTRTTTKSKVKVGRCIKLEATSVRSPDTKRSRKIYFASYSKNVASEMFIVNKA